MKKATMKYCPDDYAHKHYWESIGVAFVVCKGNCQVWKCSQCKKIRYEVLEEIEGK